VILKVGRALLAWTAEEGSRTLVHATIAGPQSHGIYINGCDVHKKHTYLLALIFDEKEN